MLLRVTAAGAQSAEPFNPYSLFSPSADAWQMTRYGGLTPSLYTGAMTFSLPLYTYRDADFTIPVSLEYAFDGYRPSMHSGIVGYGWALSCGGVITREVRGIPDEGVLDGDLYTCTIHGWRDLGDHADDIANGNGNLYSIHREIRDHVSRDALVGRMLSYDPFSDIPCYGFIDTPYGGYELYDAAPDIYHFRFMGHSGEFVTMPDGSVKVYGSDLPDGQVGVRFIDDDLFHESVTIAISTGDGYVYTFGSHDLTEMPDPYGDRLRPTKNVSTYHLTSITAPNGRTASFEYATLSGLTSSFTYNTERDGTYLVECSLCPGSGPEIVADFTSGIWGIQKESVHVPSRVTVQDGGTIEFSYGYAPADENSPSCFSPSNVHVGPNLPGPQALVKSVTVNNASGDVAEKVALMYECAASGTPKSFLSSVSSMTGGTHSFSYNLGGTSLPRNDTRATDHWGFWNGGQDDDIRIHLAAESSDLYSQMSDSSLEPSFSHTLTGAMTRITYPAGGWTDIEYERNAVTRRMNRHSGSSDLVLEPAGNPTDSVMNVGGVRVRSLSDNPGPVHDGSPSQSRTTTFGYRSGILMHMPRYSETIHYVRHVNSVSPEDVAVGTMLVNATGYSGSCANRMYLDSHIAYPMVTVNHPDGSRTEEMFTSALDAGMSDVASHGSSVGKHVLIGNDHLEPMNMLTGLPYTIPYCIAPPSGDRKAMRGKPLSTVVYSADGEEVSRKEYSYARETVAVPSCAFNGYITYHSVTWSADSPLLASVTETTHGRTARTETSYNRHGQVTSTHASAGVKPSSDSSVLWDSDILSTYTRYLHETDSTALAALVSEIVTVRDVQDMHAVTSRIHYSYSSPSVHTNPSLVRVYDVSGLTLHPSDIFAIPSGTPSKDATCSYDSLFRPTCVSLPGGAYYTYTWDRNNLSSATSNAPGNVTSYDWKDLVGLTGIHSPDGTSETYRYDSRNRLWKTFDSSGNLVRRNDVHLENEISSSVETH